MTKVLLKSLLSLQFLPCELLLCFLIIRKSEQLLLSTSLSTYLFCLLLTGELGSRSVSICNAFLVLTLLAQINLRQAGLKQCSTLKEGGVVSCCGSAVTGVCLLQSTYASMQCPACWAFPGPSGATAIPRRLSSRSSSQNSLHMP